MGKKFKLSRRTMLRGILAGGTGVAIGLPALDIFLNENGDAYADGQALPRRFGLFYWGNGVLPPRFTPRGAGTGDEWELSEQLAPLADVKPYISVVSGMQVKTGNEIAHESGLSGILAGASLDISSAGNTFKAPTIDQIIAERVKAFTRFPSIEVVVQPDGNGRSMKGPNARNPAERSPRAVFERIFGPPFRLPGAEPIIDPKLSLRRSILDSVGEQARGLQARVGSADRTRLEEHFENIRTLELQLARLEEDPPNLAACAFPEMPLEEYPEIDGRPQLSERSRAHAKVLAMALACDQTRVVSQWFSDPVSNLLFPGREIGHHRLTHDEPDTVDDSGQTVLQPEVNEIVKQIITEVAFFIQTLQDVSEGDGSLLDNMAVLCTTDVSYGRQHKLEEFPIILAGSACGKLKQDFHYLSTSNENASKVGLTLIRTMIPSQESFGLEEGYTTDSLGAIEV